MKQLSFFIFLSLLTVCNVFAQQRQSQRTSTVVVSVHGNKNQQLSIDGNVYNLNTGNIAGVNKASVSINNLSAGLHTLALTRSTNNNRRSDNISAPFNLRRNFDMHINVNANGSLELIEKRKGGVANNYTPMSDADFYTLSRNMRLQRTNESRNALLSSTFNKSNTYFTSKQAVQLLQQIRSEPERLQLAKLSFHTITDPNNFNQVYVLFNSQANKDELEDYVNYYDEDGYVNNSKIAMPETNFNNLYQTIKGQYPVSTQVSSITSAFNNTGNYFTANQASQLIQIVSNENYRLQLAKSSYRSIVDPANFNTVSNLLYSQSSRDELMAYINNGQVGNTRMPMSEADFNNLYQTIKGQWPVSTQVSSLTSAFNNTGNYFTSNQASQLIQLVNSESTRLQLAKSSYRSIVDPANFNTVSNLFYSQSSRDELMAYINNGQVGNTRMPMSEADFNNLYQSVTSQYLPYARMTALTNTFNNTANYFTVSQVKNLIQLVTNETNRVQLAKSVYRNIVDRANFTQLYDLLTLQSSKSELDAYVQAYRD